jgi:hypothetical protein
MQHLLRLKASAFFSLQKNFSCYETQQLILGTGTAIWWVTEPHSEISYLRTPLTNINKVSCFYQFIFCSKITFLFIVTF